MFRRRQGKKMPREVSVIIELKFLLSDDEEDDPEKCGNTETKIESGEGLKSESNEKNDLHSVLDSDSQVLGSDIHEVNRFDEDKENPTTFNVSLLSDRKEKQSASHIQNPDVYSKSLLSVEEEKGKLLLGPLKNKSKMHLSRFVGIMETVALKQPHLQETVKLKAEKIKGFSGSDSEAHGGDSLSPSSIQIAEELLTSAANSGITVCNPLNRKITKSKRMKKHRKNRDFFCSQCPSSFSYAHRLAYHMRTHSGEKPYVCKECNAAFSLTNNYKAHMRTHTGEKPYSCTECGANFSQRGNFKRHLRIHTGTKPHACSVCEMRFSRVDDLKGHIRIHTGEKPYVCEVCGSRFANYSNFKTHKLVRHTIEKPYKCCKCEASFKLSRALKKHMNIHQQEQFFLCENYDTALNITSDTAITVTGVV